MSRLLPPLTCLLLATAALGPPAANAGPLRLEGRIFDAPVVIEIIGGDRDLAETAMRAAYDEMVAIETMSEGADGALARLNARAGQGPVPSDPKLAALLNRAQYFCQWSGGIHGPLGGWLYAQWGLRQAVSALPSQKDLDRAISLASCSGLGVRPDGTAELRPDVRLDAWGFDRGWAVDGAVDVLVAHGITNATVRLGGVQRALGGGPDGEGWQVIIPLSGEMAVISDGVRLVDESFALASAVDGNLTVAGQAFPPFLDQRTGRTTQGVLAAATVVELAQDAQPLASTMYITGSRKGSYLAGQLRPTPSVLWLMGTGEGKPLVTDYRWSHNRLPGRGRP